VKNIYTSSHISVKTSKLSLLYKSQYITSHSTRHHSHQRPLFSACQRVKCWERSLNEK